MALADTGAIRPTLTLVGDEWLTPRASHVTDNDGRRQVTLSETWGDAWFRITAYFTADEALAIAGRFTVLAAEIEAAQAKASAA